MINFRTLLIFKTKSMKSFLIFLFLVTNALSAQNVSFKGKILDQETKEPVVFAHIKFKDSDAGISTTENGEFKIVIEKKYLNSKVIISCLGYQNTTVNASELQGKNFYLVPKIEVLQEVVIGKKFESKEVLLGSTKGKKLGLIPRNKDIMVAQFIKSYRKDACCKNLKNITITFKRNSKWKLLKFSKARIRIFDKDTIKGTPKNDLLRKNLVVTIEQGQEELNLDLSRFDIEVPKEGLFVAIEILKVSTNIAILNNEVTTYAPILDTEIRKSKHKDYGNLYFYDSGLNQWQGDKTINDLILPIQIKLTN